MSGAVMMRRFGVRIVAGFAGLLVLLTGCGLQQLDPRFSQVVAVQGVREDGTGRGQEHLGSYTFIDPGAGDPTTPGGWFDSCAPIRYRISTTNAPEGGVQEIQDAVARISAASGFIFTFIGLTDELPTSTYGEQYDWSNRFPPLLLAWGDRATVNGFPAAEATGGRAVGIGGPVRIRVGDGTFRFVSGFVMVSSELGPEEVRGFGDRWSTGQSWLHELGHVLGLGHTTDVSQAMYERLDTAQGFGSGDIEGLRKLAAMPCRSEWAGIATAG